MDLLLCIPFKDLKIPLWTQDVCWFRPWKQCSGLAFLMWYHLMIVGKLLETKGPLLSACFIRPRQLICYQYLVWLMKSHFPPFSREFLTQPDFHWADWRVSKDCISSLAWRSRCTYAFASKSQWNKRTKEFWMYFILICKVNFTFRTSTNTFICGITNFLTFPSPF